MSGTSNVGNSAVYESQDQVTRSNAEIEQEKKEARFHEGKEHSHKAQDSSMFLSASRAFSSVDMPRHQPSLYKTVH